MNAFPIIKVTPYGDVTTPIKLPIEIIRKSKLANLRRKKKESWIEDLKAYCNLTSLHGFKYLSEDNRCFWLVAIVIVYILLSYTMYDQITHFLQNPILTSFESVQTPISKIPFPSITLCPDTQIFTSAFNLTDALKNIDTLEEKDLGKLYIALSTCQLYGYITKVKTNFSKESLRQLRDPVVGEESVKRMLDMVYWDGLVLNDSNKYFQPITTFYGSCISFNMMPMDQILRYPPDKEDNWAEKYLGGRNPRWSPDDGYVKTKHKGMANITPPWHTGRNSRSPVLGILLKLPKEDGVDPSCNKKRGFMGYVHNPAELPGGSHQIFYADGGNTISLTLRPRISKVDKVLKKWTAKERGCYFQEEKWLTYFKVYTQRNCELECLTNFTVKNCGCFSSNFRPNNLDVFLCGDDEMLDCGEKYDESDDDCDCLPSCTELQYDVTPLAISWDWADHTIFYQDNKSVHTSVEVRFAGKYAQGIKRSPLFDWMDFIANMGGLLGLFLGFSILSLIEIIYHFTLRNFKRWTQHNKEKEITKNILLHNLNSYKRFV